MVNQSDGPLRRLARGRRRLRALLRLHRRRDEPVGAGALYEPGPGRARPDAGGGLPLHGGHDRSGDRVGSPAESAHGRQAILRLLRARCNPCPASRGSRVVRQIQGKVRSGLGSTPRGDIRTPEGSRRDPPRRRGYAALRRSPRGTPCRRTSNPSSRARWRYMQDSWSTPTTMLDA